MASDRWVVRTPLGEQIRLSADGWLKKILAGHPELGADPRYETEVRKTVEEPEAIIHGWAGEMLAIRECPIAPKGPKALCVVYRPDEPVGFVITAFFTSRRDKLMRRRIRWQKQA